MPGKTVFPYSSSKKRRVGKNHLKFEKNHLLIEESFFKLKLLLKRDPYIYEVKDDIAITSGNIITRQAISRHIKEIIVDSFDLAARLKWRKIVQKMGDMALEGDKEAADKFAEWNGIYNKKTGVGANININVNTDNQKQQVEYVDADDDLTEEEKEELKKVKENSSDEITEKN